MNPSERCHLLRLACRLVKTETKKQSTQRLGRVIRLLALGLLLSWTSCASFERVGEPLHSKAPSADTLRGRPSEQKAIGQTIVLVALDGVRREDVFGGVERDLALEQGLRESEWLSAEALMPNLHKLIAASGVALGSPKAQPGMRVSGPEPVSLPGYLELLTGHRESGCVNNGCARTKRLTLLDDFAAWVGPEKAAVISSWEGIQNAAASEPNAGIISTGRTRGHNRNLLRYDPHAIEALEAGERAGPGPGHGDFRRDRYTAEIAVRYLRVHKPRFLFVGLGETDEYAHRDDYRGYLRALQYGDQMIGRIASVLSEFESEGHRCTLFVTTDHGRSVDFIRHGGDAPESADIWMVAAGSGVMGRGITAAGQVRSLADISATIRFLGGLPKRGTGQLLPEVLGTAPGRLPLR